MRSSNTNILAGLLAIAAPVSAFWRLPCKAPLVVERADPIVNPGAVAGHVHTIMGGNGFGFDMDFASTQKSTCSSCTVSKDFSNYWVPTLYYKGKDGSFTSVNQVGGATIYYLQRSDPSDGSKLLAFPENFRMLAGDPMLRSFSDTLEQKAINFNCLGTSNPETNEMPNYNCPNGLRSQVFFPSCWNGKDLDSPDHKSHMAYPDRVDSGKCPSTHPKRLISLFYEVVWDTNPFADQWYDGHQPFVFSTGDMTGYGYHGDFVNGWDVNLLQKAIDQCTNLSGRVEDCPLFDLMPDDTASACKIPSSVDEQIFGKLDALPGCNPATAGPAKAVKVTGCGAPTNIGAPENPFVDLTVSKKFEYIGCGTDKLGGRTLTGPSEDKPDMTVEKCVDFCKAAGYSIAGTEYGTQCYCGNTLPADRAPQDGLMGDCFMKCGGDATENCGGAGTISLYQKCGATCSNVQYGVNNSTVGAGSPAPAKLASGAGGASTAPAPVASVPALVGAGGNIASSSAAPASKPTVSLIAPVGAGPAPSKPVNNAAGASSPGVVIQTATVIPIQAKPTYPASANAGNGGAGGNGGCNAAIHTVTIAVSTVTVHETIVTVTATTHGYSPAAAIPTVKVGNSDAVANGGEAKPGKPLYSSPAVPVQPPKVAPIVSSAAAVSTAGIYSNGTQHGHHHGKPHGTGHVHGTAAYKLPVPTSSAMPVY
jgi:hypothetical protein